MYSTATLADNHPPMQAEIFLGLLAYADELGATLVLPPFLDYEDHATLGLRHYHHFFNVSFDIITHRRSCDTIAHENSMTADGLVSHHRTAATQGAAAAT